MRKKTLFAAAPLAALLLTESALAASTAHLTVTGRILPATCNLALSVGTIRYSAIPFSDLQASSATAITPGMSGVDPTTTMQIACDAPAQIAVKVLDNRAATVASGIAGSAAQPAAANEIFGLGQDASSANIGAYSVTAVSAGSSVDGNTGKLITTYDGTTWADSATAPFDNTTGWMLSWTSAAGAGVPEPVETVTQELTVAAAVAPLDDLDSGVINLNGSMTIELIYL